jgi:signal transduction histidine kinase
MKKDFSKLSSLDSAGSAVKVMEKNNVDYLLIQEKGGIRGVVTSRGLVGYPSSRLILDCAIQPIGAISEEALADEAVKVLKEKKVSFLVVLDKKGMPVGVANQEIITNSLFQELQKLNAEKDKYITELKRAEEALRKSEESFHAIVLKSPIGILIVDSEGVVQFVNPAAESLFGREAKDLVGSVMGFPVATDQVTEIDIILRNGKYGIAEMQVVETQWLGKPAYLASFFDVTAIKEAEETLKRTNEELKKIDSMKSEFIAVASHELRTPLTSIKNAIDILVSKKAGDLTENQERFLSMAVRNINRLSTMINSLLDLTKLEAGKLDLLLSEVDIAGALQRVTESFKPQADAKLQILTADCSEDVSTVYADPARVEQILYNLVSNALKFTPEGGAIQLSARQTKSDTESDFACQDFLTPSQTGWVEISVTDTGCGLSSDDQARIFEPFYQAGDVLTSRANGSGLGLAIVKELVESQMGQISVESGIGKGSRFLFTLPIFSPQSIETAGLHEEIRKALKDYSLFSLLVVCFNHKSLPDLNHREMNGYSDLLKQLMTIVNKVINRSTDHIITQQVCLRVIIILESTPKKGAEIVKRKFNEAFSLHSIVFEGKFLSVPTILGPATFPEDGVTAKELLAAVKKRSSKREVNHEQKKSAHCR